MKILICENIGSIDTQALDRQSIGNYLIILEKNSWDDFQYKVTFDLFIMNMSDFSTQRKIGRLKIAKVGQTEHNFSNLPEYSNFTNSLSSELPELFYSLGQDQDYYQGIKDYFNDPLLEFRLLSKLKDIEKNKDKLESLKNEIVFDKAFKRTAVYVDKVESNWFNNISEPKLVFDRQIQNVRDLLEHVNLDSNNSHSISSMLFGYTVAAMEMYLFTVFSKKIHGDNEIKLKFLSNIKEKFSLSLVAENPNFIEETLDKEIGNISFHNVGTSKKLFWEILNHQLMTDDQSSYFSNSIEIRHDCAHRGGYDKEGNPTPIDTAMIEELIVKIITVVENVEKNVIY